MKKKRISAVVLALVMVLAMALPGCAGKSEDAASGGGSAGSAKSAQSEEKETSVTAETKEDAKKLAEDFYGSLATANPVTMTTYFDGEETSVFMADGDTMFLGSEEADLAYYLFIEDGKKYFIGDDETAYEDEYMYDMFAESMKSTIDMFVMGYYEAEEDDAALQFSATRTDKTVGGVTTSKLVTVITGEDDGKAMTLTLTGTAENGAVSDIIYELDDGEEKQTAEFKISYDSVSIELPEYTIGESYGEYGANLEGEHVPSPYQTLGELMATLDEDESLFYTMGDGVVYAVGEKDGRQYQFTAAISEEDQKTYYELDFFSESYEEDVDAILAKLTVDDCVDFTDCIVPQSELDAFVGQTAGDLVNAGYELTGWSVYEGSAVLSFSKDYMEYEAEAEPTPGFDENSEFEGEDLYGFTIKTLRFNAPEYAALPIQ